MQETDYSTYSNEEIGQLVTTLLPEKLQKEVSKMLPAQITAAVLKLQITPGVSWLEKVRAIYLGLNRSEQLEAVGRGIRPEHVLDIVKAANLETDEQRWKLIPFLVGMSHQVFLTLLATATKEDLVPLQQKGMSEPIQNHLMLFIHDMTQSVEHEVAALQLIEKEIQALEPGEIDFDKLDSLQQQIAPIKESTERHLTKINRALALAWNTNRSDIIDRLTSLKETCQRLETLFIGAPREENHPPSGMYKVQENHFGSVYGNPANPRDIETLADDEPAVEALAKLSIWYFKDYWEVGFFPDVETPEQLELDPSTHSEQEQMEYQEKLLATIQKKLEVLGLTTVGDLKAAHIYSKQMLRDYINKHKHLM